MRRRPRRPDGKRGRIKRRILKKTAPLKWGTIALISDDDRPHQDATIPPQKRRDVAVVVWKDLRQYRRSAGGVARRSSYACYCENGDKVHHGSIGGTLHFPAGAPASVVVHEAAHAALHGERILNGGGFDFKMEERFCYRLQRLCEAIWEYLAER